MDSLGGKFQECAREIIETAAGETPPADFPTVMLENMIKEVVEPSGSVSEEFTIHAIQSMAAMSKGGAKELSSDEIKTVIKKHFTM